MRPQSSWQCGLPSKSALLASLEVPTSVAGYRRLLLGGAGCWFGVRCGGGAILAGAAAYCESVGEGRGAGVTSNADATAGGSLAGKDSQFASSTESHFSGGGEESAGGEDEGLR